MERGLIVEADAADWYEFDQDRRAFHSGNPEATTKGSCKPPYSRYHDIIIWKGILWLSWWCATSTTT